MKNYRETPKNVIDNPITFFVKKFKKNYLQINDDMLP